MIEGNGTPPTALDLFRDPFFTLEQRNGREITFLTPLTLTPVGNYETTIAIDTIPYYAVLPDPTSTSDFQQWPTAVQEEAWVATHVRNQGLCTRQAYEPYFINVRARRGIAPFTILLKSHDAQHSTPVYGGAETLQPSVLTMLEINNSDFRSVARLFNSIPGDIKRIITMGLRSPANDGFLKLTIDEENNLRLFLGNFSQAYFQPYDLNEIMPAIDLYMSAALHIIIRSLKDDEIRMPTPLAKELLRSHNNQASIITSHMLKLLDATEKAILRHKK